MYTEHTVRENFLLGMVQGVETIFLSGDFIHPLVRAVHPNGTIDDSNYMQRKSKEM